MPLSAEQSGVGGGLTDWQHEANQRIAMAKHCEALALLRVGDADRFLDDLLGIGVEERKRISRARGAPLPCAVLDKLGQGLPFELAQFGIERFDVDEPDWRANSVPGWTLRAQRRWEQQRLDRRASCRRNASSATLPRPAAIRAPRSGRSSSAASR